MLVRANTDFSVDWVRRLLEKLNRNNIKQLYSYIREIMTPVVDGLCLLFSFLSISEAMMCQQYRVNLEVDNKVSQQAPSENLHDVSFATCSRSCIKGCECFSFNTQSNMCRLYMYSSSCDPSNMTVSEAGWRSYTIYETKPPGRT